MFKKTVATISTTCWAVTDNGDTDTCGCTETVVLVLVCIHTADCDTGTETDLLALQRVLNSIHGLYS